MKKRLPLLLLAALYSCNAPNGSDVAPSGSFTVGSPGGSGSSGSSGGSGSNTANPGGTGQAGVVTAGEWNDLHNWSFWLDVLNRSDWATLPARWQLYPTEHYTVTLTTPAGQPLAGAQVTLGNAATTTGIAAAETDRLGQAHLFPTLFQAAAPAAALPLHVSYQGQTFTPTPVAANEHAATRTLAATPVSATPVDVMFVVDATSSMSDEISYLKTELRDVAQRASIRVPGATLRLSSVFYRDNGDDYLTRAQDFTTNITRLTSFVQQQDAGGGGDFQEAVEEGLATALQQQWSPAARCRLLFLLLDAPPHDDAAARIRTLAQEAARRGIRLIPITASGIDTNTEFLMRTLALSTNGTYVFITDHSGIGNSHLEASVGAYQVEYLNNLMVRLIGEYSQP